MPRTRTLTLELLRHGPSHNQLLSPLTPYLALCGNHDPETVHIDVEHRRFDHWMRGLRYLEGPRGARAAREEVADAVGKAIGSIHALTSELSTASEPGSERDLVHLRLILSSAELALLPFELILSPPGFPGEGQRLSLQHARPIALTREARRVPASTVTWPDRPRLLVVAASPQQPVPLRRHLLALCKAMDPYLVSGDEKELAEHVTVLEAATLEAVRTECARTQYTHVHLLMHGAALREDDASEGSYGLAFHDENDPEKVDVVNGERLALALRGYQDGGGTGPVLSTPVVVTVASCDSGNVGSVVSPGGSIAHALHEAGVPLVFASQFPLSFDGSVVMAEEVYRWLLRGEDPRRLVHHLHRTLAARFPSTHDWASVVVYAALPTDIEHQLAQARFKRAHAALNTIQARIDRHREHVNATPGAALSAEHKEQLKRDYKDLLARMRVLEMSVPGQSASSERLSAYGLLASAKKQVARLLQVRGAEGALLDTDDDVSPEQMLEESRQYYVKCFRLAPGEPWPLVQYLVLSSVLGDEDGAASSDLPRGYEQIWDAAYFLAVDNLDPGYAAESTSPPQQRLLHAHGALAELFVLAQKLRPGHWAHEECRLRALEAARRVVAIARENAYPQAAFDAYSVLRQLRRYAELWWVEDPHNALPEELFGLMRDAGVRERWPWQTLVR